VLDTGEVEVENIKTIFVGSNEAGKTAVLQALQQINPPKGVTGFNALRDYPRSLYNDITDKRVDPAKITVAEATFTLEKDDIDALPEGFKDCTYTFGRFLDNNSWHKINGGLSVPIFKNLKKDLQRLSAHMDSMLPAPKEGVAAIEKPSELLNEIIKNWADDTKITNEAAKALKSWLERNINYVDENKPEEDARYDLLVDAAGIYETRNAALQTLQARLPVFVLFNNYFRVKPLIQLDHLAKRLETRILDDDQYDYGNSCLLKLLGFTARELSNLGNAARPAEGDAGALQVYREQLDKRAYQLNAASIRLTDQINQVWQPDPERDEASRLRIQADGQYLKVVVEDALGVEIELDQRSEGFQWLVSFFVVFFAESQDKHKNAILLLDEPGLSLHGLKQREFRNTLSKLAASNQTIYTTHSPFLVGPDELDIVRVAEMKDRRVGTKIHTTITTNDPVSLLPLQEALGYDLAQSLFGQERNLVLEGLTDYWYLDATAHLLRSVGIVNLDEKISLVPAGDAGKVVYYATILHAQKLKVTALFDSDTAGDQAANQDNLVHKLGNKNILRTKDVYKGDVTKPEIEDLLRQTLIEVAMAELKWDISETARKQPTRPVVDIFSDEVPDFSKYKLAKAYLRWMRSDKAALKPEEIEQWKPLIEAVNRSLK
jgi:hypothetical protein